MTRWILTSILILGVLGCAKEVSQVKVKTNEPCIVVSIKETGHYDKIGPVIEELYGWLGEKEVKPVGSPFGIFYDNPEEVEMEALRWEICVPVEAEFEGDDRVEIKNIESAKVAYLIHMGPYEDVGPAWKEVYAWLFKNNYTPTGAGMEVYLNDPKKVPQDSIMVEIQVPIKEKEK